jgi:serine/threonine-protein kinase
MLFEMLTGVQPHTGDSPLAVAHKHVSHAVPVPSSVVPRLPPALDALVIKATSRDPGRRLADAGEFLRAVTEVRRSIPAPPEATARTSAPRTAGLAGDLPPSGNSWFPWNETDHGAVPVYGPAAQHGGPNNTLVVPAAGDLEDGYRDHGTGYPARRPAAYRPSYEPFLQRWLYSRRLVYLALGVAAAVIIAVATWWVTDGQYTTVPQVGGMAVSTARTELQNLGFTVRIGPVQHSNSVPAGDVIGTSPATGSNAHRGAVVTVTESSGPDMITVPNVTGMQTAAAKAALRKAGLTPGVVTQEASSTIPAGIVISTTPAAGASWPQPKPVGLAVSSGPPLPDFTGQMFQTAQSEAQAGGYQLQQVAAVGSNEPQGTIVGQSPQPGTPITPNEVVTVQVSNGPPQVAIPDVQGQPVAAATAALQAAGFQVQVANQGSPLIGNTVASYSPTGQAPQGTTITLTLGSIFP